jgi:hypothetical protein
VDISATIDAKMRMIGVDYAEGVDVVKMMLA